MAPNIKVSFGQGEYPIFTTILEILSTFEMRLEILYEDNHLLALNKPAGQLVHGDKTGDLALDTKAKSYLKAKYNKPGNVFIGVCHRLDRPVSGVLLFSRTSKALPRLNLLFQQQKVKKTYWAVSDRLTKSHSGIVAHHLMKDRARNAVKVVDAKRSGAKQAITHYSLQASLHHRFLYQLHPQTGRSHQIRMAMRSLDCPILGDVKYGGRSINDPSCILLHCRSMIFTHPVRKDEVEIIAPLPQHTEWQIFAP